MKKIKYAILSKNTTSINGNDYLHLDELCPYFPFRFLGKFSF